MEMKPRIFFQICGKGDKVINDSGCWPAVIGTRQTQIMQSFRLHQSTLCLPLLHSKLHRVLWQVIFRRVCRDGRTQQTGKCFFLRFHFLYGFSKIGCIVRTAPGNGDSVDKTMTLQPAVYYPDLFRSFFELFRKTVKLIFGELCTSGHAFVLQKPYVCKFTLPGIHIISVNTNEYIIRAGVRSERFRSNNGNAGNHHENGCNEQE